LGPRVVAGEVLRRKAAARDWKKYPAVVEVRTSQDVFALGDVHGDYDRLVALLVAGKVIPKGPAQPDKVRWAAGRAVLVCTGDLIDKGDASLKVITLFRAIQAAAAKKGGQVIVTMGNHEADFLTNPANKKATKFGKELRAQGVKPEEVAAGRDGLGVGRFLRTLPFAARVNDWFFAHAGDTRKYSLKQLRSTLQEGVDAHGYDIGLVPVLQRLIEARLEPRPWWEKKGDSAADSKARLLTHARALGVKHLVVGHKPGKVVFSDQTHRDKGELYQKFDGLIFLIDVGMSRGIDDSSKGYSKGALLKIRAGKQARATAIYPDGREQPLWPNP
jgi:hypothetical protein